jgi:sugar O-acyltransferase (sialic acid O-acetyltransferase NeuD family)
VKNKVLILGAGGLGKAIHEAFISRGEFEVAGFLDDNRQGTFCGLPILGPIDSAGVTAEKNRVTHAVVALGYQFQTRRHEIYKKISTTTKLQPANAVHASVVLAKDVKLGKGIFLGMNACVNAGTTIGDNTVVWTGAIIDHDNEIGKNVFMATGAMTAGYVTIEDHVFIGMGAKIAKAHIGENATVGAGALVLKDVERFTYVKGIPAVLFAKKTTPSYLVSDLQ